MQGDRASREKPLVLIADDDATVRFLVREALEIAGFAVEDVADGCSAVSAFDTLRPDLIILDVRMPGMDGFSACATIRNCPFGRDVPILMLSGMNVADIAEHAAAAGATGVISKPFSLAKLGQHVWEVLRQSSGTFPQR